MKIMGSIILQICNRYICGLVFYDTERPTGSAKPRCQAEDNIYYHMKPRISLIPLKHVVLDVLLYRRMTSV